MRALTRLRTSPRRKAFLRSLHVEKERPGAAERPCKLLFPGQGSQYVGMTSTLSSNSSVEGIFASASRVLGYDLRAVCVEGPQETLDETVHCQPAVVVASLAALEHHKSRDQAEGGTTSCQAVAGFSVGEFTALIFAQALSLQAGLELVSLRATAMQEACEEQEGSMMTVVGLEEQALRSLCQEAGRHNTGLACIGNFIFPRGFVVSGSKTALKYVRERAVEMGAASVKDVQVSGAFHSPLMSSAVPKLRSALRRVPIKMPSVNVFSNVTGRPYTSVEEIRRLLAEQVVRPVQWLTTITNMIDTHGVDGFAEVGPGRQLKSMLRRINRDAYRSCVCHEA